MAADTQDGKRQRLSSWSGPSQSHSVHHHPSDSSASYANPALPLPIPHPAYHEHDQRELPNVYHAGSGYATPMDGVAHSYPPDQAFARPSGTTIKTGSPGEPPHPPLRSLSLPGPSDGSHALQAHQMDHPSLETHHAMSMSNHDGMPPTHSGSYAPSPISSGPRDSYYMGGPLVTTYPPRRKAIRAAQVRALIPLFPQTITSSTHTSRPVMRVGNERPNATKAGRPVASVRKPWCPASIERSLLQSKAVWTLSIPKTSLPVLT